jgi:polynucleotide 5'-hydroxyl-kinase GRC3/NOL9
VFGVGLHRFGDDNSTIFEDDGGEEEVAVCGEGAVKVCRGGTTALGYSDAATDKTNTWHRLSCPWYCSSVVIREDLAAAAAPVRGKSSSASSSLETMVLEALHEYRTVLLFGALGDLDEDSSSPGGGAPLVHRASSSPGSVASFRLLNTASCEKVYMSEAPVKVRQLQGKGFPAITAHRYIGHSPGITREAEPHDASEDTFSAPPLKDVRTTEDRIMIDPSWSKAVDVICKDIESKSSDGGPPSVLVCGCQSTGKSTLCRYVLNRILSVARRDPEINGDDVVCAYLETDLGQPEFTPSGLVSLHLLRASSPPLFGLPHTHLRKPEVSFFIGDSTPKKEPVQYLAVVQKAVEYYRERYELEFLPLVVNTHGWVHGMGGDMLESVVDQVCPRFLLRILPPSPSKAYNVRIRTGEGQDAKGWTKTLEVEPYKKEEILSLKQREHQQKNSQNTNGGKKPNPPQNSKIPAATLRDKRLANYFIRPVGGVAMLPSKMVETLLQMRPLVVPFDALHVVACIGTITQSEVLTVLNGSLVGLMSSKGSAPVQSAIQAARNAASEGGNSSPVGPLLLHSRDVIAEAPCCGLGIVRGLHMQKRLLYLLAPFSLEEMRTMHVDVLLVGTNQVPTDLLHQRKMTTSSWYSMGGKEGGRKVCAAAPVL